MNSEQLFQAFITRRTSAGIASRKGCTTDNKAVKFYARIQCILELADPDNLTTQLLIEKRTAMKGFLITRVTFH